MQIHKNTFIVTGGASGLGGAVSRMIAATGGNVVIADVQSDKGEALARELGAGARFIGCDVTRAEDAMAAVQAAQALGALRGLVNCAGVAIGEKTVGKEGPHALANFARVIGVNLIGTFNMIRVAANAMSKLDATADGERGVLINTASVAAYDGQIGQAAYSASKGGVLAMALPIARDLMNDGVRVNTILPGIFKTPMMAMMPAQVQDALAAQVPFPKRLGTAEEYARLALFIVENSYLNAESIRLDGGIRMAPR